MRTSRPLLTLLLLAFVPWGSFAAQPPNADDGFFGDKGRGWHFYERKPAPKPLPKPTPPPPGGGSGGPSQAEGMPAPPPMGTAWLRENLPKYADLAIDQPTEENVRLYYYLIRLTNDRAAAFQQATERMMRNTPELDEERRVPTTGYAASAARQAAKATIEEVMQRISERAGLMYFFRSDCTFCAKQSTALAYVRHNHPGLAILPVSMDGLPMQDGSTPSYQVDEGQGAMIGVQATPTFAVAVPETGEIVKLAEGLQTMPQLEDRLIDFAERRGWISKQEMQLIEKSRSDFLQAQLPADGSTPSDPAVLLSLLEAAGQSAGSTPLTTSPIQP